MPKGVPHKRYTSEFKKHVVETMLNEGLSYKETERRFELTHMRAANGSVSTLKKDRRDSRSSEEDAAVQVAPGNCPEKWKKICSPKYSVFARRTNT